MQSGKRVLWFIINQLGQYSVKSDARTTFLSAFSLSCRALTNGPGYTALASAVRPQYTQPHTNSGICLSWSFLLLAYISTTNRSILLFSSPIGNPPYALSGHINNSTVCLAVLSQSALFAHGLELCYLATSTPNSVFLGQFYR